MQNTTLVSIICILTRSMHNTYYSGVLYELVVSIIYILVYYTSLLYAYSLLARCYAYYEYSSCGNRVCILLILYSNIMHNNSSTTSIASTHSITVIVL